MFLPPAVLPQQVVNRRGASVDAPQHVPGASVQVPAQRQPMEVGKQTHLKCGGREAERDFRLTNQTTHSLQHITHSVSLIHLEICISTL